MTPMRKSHVRLRDQRVAEALPLKKTEAIKCHIYRRKQHFQMGKNDKDKAAASLSKRKLWFAKVNPRLQRFSSALIHDMKHSISKNNQYCRSQKELMSGPQTGGLVVESSRMRQNDSVNALDISNDLLASGAVTLEQFLAEEADEPGTLIPFKG